ALRLLYLVVGSEAMAVEQPDFRQQLFVDLDLLPGNLEARLQAANGDIEVGRLGGDTRFRRLIVRKRSFASSPQPAEHVDFPTGPEVRFIGVPPAVIVRRAAE